MSKEKVLHTIQVSDAWANFILFVQREVPFGEVKIKVVNGEPIEPRSEEHTSELQSQVYISRMPSSA